MAEGAVWTSEVLWAHLGLLGRTDRSAAAVARPLQAHSFAEGT
jgi:hypothetical protein